MTSHPLFQASYCLTKGEAYLDTYLSLQDKEWVFKKTAHYFKLAWYNAL